MRQKILSFLLLSSWILTFLHFGTGFAQVDRLETLVTHNFGESIEFRAEVLSDIPIRAAVLFFQADGDTHTNIGLGEVQELGKYRFELRHTHLIETYSLRPFSTVNFHWELTLANGETYTSPVDYFEYTDNRFDWQTLQEDDLQVHWYAGDLQFAQRILDIAEEGRARIQGILPMPGTGGIEMYIYSNSNDLQDALRDGGESWVAGHADPDLGVILISLPDTPERQLLARQRIPHELMHVLLYRETGAGYYNLPVWLREGLASLAELHPNPDYQILLQESAEQGTLLPIHSLCDAFPREAYNALLSYAESQSFTNYLYSTYGTSGLDSLVTAYANGMDCESGAARGLGHSLRQLERDWQRDVLSQNVALKAAANLMPWLILMVVIIAVPLLLALASRRVAGVQQQTGQGTAALQESGRK